MKLRRFTINLIVMALLFACSCDSAFYYPNKRIYTKPENYSYEDRYIQSKSGNRLHLRYVKSNKHKGLFIHFHGNAQNLTAHYSFFSWVLDEGYDYLIFDYSGYGKSQGSPSREKLYQDGQALFNYINTSFKRPNKSYRYVVIGQSLGGAVVIPALADSSFKDKVHLLVLDCTFHSYESIGAYHIRILPKTLGKVFFSSQYEPKDYVKKLKGTPILVTHCKEDSTVPIEFGKALFNLAKSPKWFWEFNCGHIGGFYSKNNRQRLITFINSIKK